jgi:hypothetical protein
MDRSILLHSEDESAVNVAPQGGVSGEILGALRRFDCALAIRDRRINYGC